jgi:hypothetical protein
MTKCRSLLLASLLGGLAIHGALVACSGSGNAGAQTTPCQQWAVFEVDSSSLATGPTVTTSATAQYPAQTFLAPAGWEPYAGSSNSYYFFRKCMP